MSFLLKKNPGLAVWTAHFCVHTCIVLNKNWKTYWSEQSFAGLKPEEHVLVVRTGLFHDVYQRGISRNIFHDCGKFYLLFEWGIVVQELETSNFTAEWKLYRITAILKLTCPNMSHQMHDYSLMIASSIVWLTTMTSINYKTTYNS